MNHFFSIDAFTSNYITGRKESLFADDLRCNEKQIETEFQGKSVLVIGGAGTIGSHFIKALLPYKPGKLIVIDNNENALAELVRTCRSTYKLSLPGDFKTYPVDFGDAVFRKIFEAEAPFDIVANFAAHKHVRSEKDVFSIEAMINNNVLKAKDLLELLQKHPPKHFFCVSTDKAAAPMNVMGASKKLMEEVILSYSDDIKISTARFANVAFSNGSLLDGYIQRIFKKEPLSCPFDVKRYFISPAESGEICLLACVLGKSGDIFFPKLNIKADLVSFKDITLRFLETLQLSPVICKTDEEARQKAAALCDNPTSYPVYFFESQTSGEKLYEEFYTYDEVLDTDIFNAIGVIKNAPRRTKTELDNIIGQLNDLFDKPATKADVIKALHTTLPHFSHTETGMHLDQKM